MNKIKYIYLSEYEKMRADSFVKIIEMGRMLNHNSDTNILWGKTIISMLNILIDEGNDEEWIYKMIKETKRIISLFGRDDDTCMWNHDSRTWRDHLFYDGKILKKEGSHDN